MMVQSLVPVRNAHSDNPGVLTWCTDAQREFLSVAARSSGGSSTAWGPACSGAWYPFWHAGL